LRWVEGVFELLSFAPYPSRWATANAISPDGSVVVGETSATSYPDALVWRDGVLSYLPRPDLPQPRALAADVSADGRTIVGTARFPVAGGTRDFATRWVDGELRPLPDPPQGAEWTWGRFVSDDGSVVAGLAQFTGVGRQPVRWVGEQPEILADPEQEQWLDIRAMAHDGSVVVGTTVRDGDVYEAVRWKDGALQGLGGFAGGNGESRAVDATADGEVVFGSAAVGPDPCYPQLPAYDCPQESEPFVWTSEIGMLDLQEWLRFGCGYDVINWGIGARAVSDAGTRLAIVATPAGSLEPANYLVEIGHCVFDYEVPEWKTGVGDYYFVDYEHAVYRMHGETREIERVTSFGQIYLPVDLEIGPDGSLYVLSKSWERIVRVDPETGEQSIVSQYGLIDEPAVLAQGVDGTLYTLRSEQAYGPPGTIVAIDPGTGAQRVLTQGGWLGWSSGLTRGGNGNLLTLQHPDDVWWVVEIDVETGAQTPVVALDLPPEATTGAIAYDARRGRLLARGPRSELLAIDLESGVTTALTGANAVVWDLGMGSDGDALGIVSRNLHRIDGDTGELEMLQSGGRLELPRAIREVLAACDDGLDNDADALADADDPGCRSHDDDSELHRSDVRIDVDPWDPHNRIALLPGWRVRVAVLGSDTVDVRDLDADSLAFGPAGAPPVPPFPRLSLDIDRDGHRDLLASFRVEDAGIDPRDAEACLTGTLEGIPFRACDAVEVLVHPGCGQGVEAALLLPAGFAAARLRRRRGRSPLRRRPVS
jgi:hypothetical protein